MAFESFAHVPVTEVLLRHVWEGEPNGHQGGHRYGLGREGKTEFPESWDLARVEHAIHLTISHPQAVRFKSPFIYCDRVVSSVLLRVRLKNQGSSLFIETAYPICGDDVCRIVAGLRQSLPLDFSRLET